MSLTAIRKALESALDAISPPINTAWENTPPAFVGDPATPYQTATVLLAEPANIEIGPGYWEQGILAINLFYPKDGGPKPAHDRAELIRTAFPFAASLVSGGQVVNIIATPEVVPARIEDDRFMVPVRIRFQARGG